MCFKISQTNFILFQNLLNEYRDIVQFKSYQFPEIVASATLTKPKLI